MIPRYIQIIVLILDIDRDRRVEISPLIRVKKHQYCRKLRQYRRELTAVIGIGYAYNSPLIRPQTTRDDKARYSRSSLPGKSAR